jgi:hypothetical protein
MKIVLTFTEELLGTLSGNKKIAEEFILSKRKEGMAEDEILALAEHLEKESTVFAKSDGKPHLWDYQVKGFFKEACQAMIGTGAFTQEELKKLSLTTYMHRRTIDNLIFVKPRKLFVNYVGEIGVCERPLRGQTMQGERICLARSETLPAGSTISCEVIILNEKLKPVIGQWLTYGVLKGLGQWRNGSKGRFEWVEVKD